MVRFLAVVLLLFVLAIAAMSTRWNQGNVNWLDIERIERGVGV